MEGHGGGGGRRPRARDLLRGAPGLQIALLARERGGAAGATLLPLQRARLASLTLSPTTELVSDAGCARGEVLWLDLDAAEQRYLLAAAGDGAIEVYDVQARGLGDANAGSGHTRRRLAPVGSVRQRSRPESAHRFAATCVAWYPVDTGMFVSGSADKTLRLWDTNTLDAVCVFQCDERISCCAMSPIARAHCLVAAGGEGRAVRLADPATGAFSHLLTGHRDPVLSVAWSLGSEHQLLSGDAGGEVRLWDVRRPGSRALLDLDATTRPRGGGGARKRRRGGAGGADSARRAVAHDGGVTSILPTPDGLHWVTGGRDGRLRLWDAGDHTHLLVHYAAPAAPPRRPVRLAATEDGRALFQPCGAGVYDVSTGAVLARLRQGHFEPVTAAAWSPLTQQLYTSASDGAVLAWAPRGAPAVEDEELWEWRRARAAPDWAALDEDDWSDGY
ncbi:MAG: WD40-repeat-containing domain protein [Monoraphidium minutum]|nr:MAG: WD40-repeat-containing domain protein [Monoraphidium minutum]